jgi:glycosyltransferase involved in cell wall biosynthesis
MHGIAISTFMTEQNVVTRLQFFQDCLSSLLATNFEGPIVVVDDCSTVTPHLEWLRQLDDTRVVIHRKNKNGGISRVKNTGLNILFDKYRCDQVFLSDDDMIFKHKDWHTFYLNALINSDIKHLIFSSSVTGSRCGSIFHNKGYSFLQTTLINGCLLSLTRELFENVGYFKVATNRYGHEHTQYSIRIKQHSFYKGYYDLANAEDLVGLNPNSLNNHSIGFTMEEINQNSKDLFGDMSKQPFVD